MSQDEQVDELLLRWEQEFRVRNVDTPVEQLAPEQPELWGALRHAVGAQKRALQILYPAPPTLGLPRNAPASLPEIPGYCIVEELGRGGMGIVYRAMELEFQRPVAIKLIHAERTEAEDAIRRFKVEAGTAARLQHPGVPPVHCLGLLPDAQPYLVMKLIEGRTLAAVLSERSADLSQRLHVFEQVCQTVAYAHQQGVVHRDLKPNNIMVGAFGEVQVMDWGLARRVETQGPDAGPIDATELATETQTGAVLGTPAYMPPEQARGENRRVDSRADVFALGAILCELLTGQTPYAFLASAPAATREASLTEARRCLASSTVDTELSALARRCLAPDSADRPADASVLAQVLAEHRRQVELRLRNLEREQAAALVKAVEERSRRRAQRWLAAAVLLLISVGLGFAWFVERAASVRRGEQLTRSASARAAVEAALAQVERSLRHDKPDEARIALAEAERRLEDDQVDGLDARFRDLRRQLTLLTELDRIRDRVWMISEGKAFNVAAAARDFAKAFAGIGSDLNALAAEPEMFEGFAIRDQVLGALDLWLGFAPKQAGLADWLRKLDPDPDRNAWRELVVAGGGARLEATAAKLLENFQPPRFVAAYDYGLPRDLRVRMLRQALERHPSSLSLAFNLGTVLGQGNAKEKEEAAGYLRVCLALRPDHVSSLNNLGNVLAQMQDLQGALAHYRKATELEPSDAVSRTNLGNIHQLLGDYDLAIAHFQHASKLDPTFVLPYRNCSNALQKKGDWQGAIASARQAVEAGPNDIDALLCISSLLAVRQETLDEAIGHIRKALALDPLSAKAHSNLGLALHHKGQSAEGAASCRTAVRLAPDNATMHYNLGTILIHDPRQADEAIQCCRAAIALNADYAEAHTNLGILLLARRDFEGALASHKRSIAANPNHAGAYYNLAVAVHTADPKNFKTPIFYYNKALAVDPSYVPAHNNIAFLLLEAKDLSGAAARFRKILEIDGHHARAWCGLGVCLLREGRFAEALEPLQRGHDLGSRQPGWDFPSTQLLRDARRMNEFEQRLPAVLADTDKLASAQECIAFADFCAFHRARFADSARLYSAAILREPALADDLTKPYRFNAACAAVRAAQGEGVNPPLQADQPALRKQALDWLRADLAAWRKAATMPSDLQRQRLSAALTHWLGDADLVSVRDPKQLLLLPADDCRAWEQLWVDVRNMLKENASPTPTSDQP